jgi:DNA-directed RNA polymerase specialized sigma24 family protein
MNEGPSSSDKELISLSQAGNSDAFDVLVVRYSRRLYKQVYDMGLCHEASSALLQDVFAKAYRLIGQFRQEANFFLWIQSLAVEMTRDLLVMRGRKR